MKIKILYFSIHIVYTDSYNILLTTSKELQNFHLPMWLESLVCKFSQRLISALFWLLDSYLFVRPPVFTMLTPSNSSVNSSGVIAVAKDKDS